MTIAEANYCRANAARFSAQVLCRRCQGHSPRPERKLVVKPARVSVSEPDFAAPCAVCGSGVEKKVANYCRFNSKRFAGRVLCRTCQASAAS